MLRALILRSLLLALPLPLFAFDLKPKTVVISGLDGEPAQVSYFHNDGVFYRPHLFGTTLTGDSQQAVFAYNGIEGAEMKLRNCVLVSKGKTAADINDKALIEAAREYGPSGATPSESKITPCAELLSRDIPAYEVTTTYELPGSEVWQSVLFCTLIPDHPMVMITTAYAEQADEARKMTIRIARALETTTLESLSKPMEH